MKKVDQYGNETDDGQPDATPNAPTPGQAGDPAYDANPRDAMVNRDSSQWGANLNDYANSLGWKGYDGAELQDVQRWASNAANAGKDPAEAIAAAKEKIKARAANNTGPAGNGTPPTNGVSSWVGSSTPGTGQSSTQAAQTNPQQDMLTALLSQQQTQYAQMQADRQAADATNKARNDELYNTLQTRATQSLDLNPNDPIIKGQTTAYNANADRAKSAYLSDLAEKVGPLANMGGETRLANEQYGRDTGAFQAELMGRELTSRRAEISDALNGMRGMLTADQQQSLQRELGLLDNAISQQQVANQGRSIDVTSQLGNRNADTDLLRAILQNQQFGQQLGQNQDQFNAQLGFNTTDRANYWDWLAANGGQS